MRLDIDYRGKKTTTTLKNANTWRLNNTFLNNKQITEEIREIKTYLETKNNENMMICPVDNKRQGKGSKQRGESDISANILSP